MMWLSREVVRRIGGLYSIFSFLLLLVLSGLPLHQAYSDVAEGVAWLSSQQLSDGSYADSSDVANPTQSTSETLRTFYFLGEDGQAGVVDAQSYLDAETYRNTENLSRLIVSTVQSGGDASALVAVLFTHQNRDGGFGELPGYDSTVLDTAFAVEALAASNQPKAAATFSAVYFLMNRQQADGGWYDGANETTVYTTALALNALRHFRNDVAGASDSLIGAKRFLLNQRSATGLWSENFVTATVLIALVNSVNEYSEVEHLVNDFASKQAVNGSWDESPFATALALRALSSRPVPAPQPPTTGSLSGRVLDDQTRQAINGASITIEGSSLSGNSGPTGEFTVQDLAPGNVTVHIDMPGYSQRSYSATLVAGQVTGLGDVLMTLLPTTAAMQGLVTDDQTGLPLSDATVTLSGSSSATVATDTFGKYTLSNLQPGAFTVTVTKSGYENVMANGSLSAGSSLVFSPSLKKFEITEQTDPNQPSTGTATLHGRVLDINSRQGLQGATVTVTGSATATTQTSTYAYYSISGLTPGDVQITVTQPGYLPVTASTTLQADSDVEFNPMLTSETTTYTDGTLYGQVVDLVTQTPLSGVVVTITADQFSKVIVTGSSGNFRAYLPEGGYSLSFTDSGYVEKSLSAVVNGGGEVDLQRINMEPVLSKVSIRGVISDNTTGLPVQNATVTVEGTSSSVQTDEQGVYLLEALDPGLMRLVFNATGYSSQTLLFNFSVPGAYEIDRSLFQSELSPVSITSFGVGQANYAAYTDVGMNATVVNDSNAPVEGVLEYTIMNSAERVVAVVQGTWVDVNGNSQTSFTLDSGASLDFSAVWDTGFTPPGSYRAIARVVVGDLMVGPANITLAERATSFDIDSTEALAKVEVNPLPAFSGVGRTEDVDFVLGLVNRSNVATDLSVRFQVSKPDGLVIHTHTEAVSLAPEEDNKSLDIPGIPILFESSGSYAVTVDLLSQQAVETVSGGEIAVAPGVRIEATQNIAPQTVTPDEDKRVRINIRLEGVELK